MAKLKSNINHINKPENHIKRRHVFVIGAPKSGTTWLQHILDSDSRFYLPPYQEVHFFDSEQPKPLHLYEELFSGAGTSQVTVDVTPDYLAGLETINAISEYVKVYNISPIFVILLREPAERAFSHYQMFKNRHSLNTSFKDFLVSGNDIYECSLYGTKINAWMREFGKHNINIYLFDTIAENPEFILDDLSNQIGIDPPISSHYANLKVNSGGLDKTRTWPIIKRVVGQFLRKQKLTPLVHHFKRNRFVRAIDRLNKKKIRPSPDEKKLACQLFRDEILFLDELAPELGIKEKWRY